MPSVLYGNVHGIEKGGQVCDEPVAVGAAAAYHILPYQHSQPVAVIVPALRLYFDMLSEHIEAKILHGPDVINKCFVAGGGVQAVGPVALIQDAGLHIGAVIQENTAQAVAAGLDIAFAHGKITFHPVILHFQGCMVKEGILRGPGMETRQGQDCLPVRGKGTDTHCAGGLFAGCGTRRIVPVLSVLLRFRPDRTADWPSLSAAAGSNPYAAAGTVIIRHKMDRRNIGIGDKLKPYGLPDAALGSIKHTSLIKLLLSSAVTGGITVIPHAHQKLVGGFFGNIRYIQCEGKISARVLPRRFPINKYGTFLIHSAEME